MCGFFLSVGDVQVDIRALTESIRHRGPDSTRYFVGERVSCGFNRLAIVDDNPRSDQPMLDQSGRHLLLFNGEIYNYGALRHDLTDRHGARFQTESDTEVLLSGLLLEGASFAGKLDGIYAFAFVDLETLQVLIGRDVFGVKPLYYRADAGRLYVSSELRPLRALGGGSLSWPNVSRYLAYGMVGSGQTIVAGISEVEPNSVMAFHGADLVATTIIHEFCYDAADRAEPEEIAGLLERTIESQKPAIAYGVMFSGGIDSTLLLDRCAEDRNLTGAYSVNVQHPDMSERPWQEHALGCLGLGPKWRVVELDSADLSVAGLTAVSAGLDYPLFHPNFVGSLLLTRRAAEDGLKVLLSGEGADEVFLGYRWFFSQFSPSDYLEYVPLEAIGRILGEAAVRPVATDDLSIVEIFQQIYIRRWLLRQDMTGMVNSIEVRVPFLGLELAHAMNRLSTTFKKGSGESKWILKEMLLSKFGAAFVHRKKVGFDFPLNDWITDEHVAYLRAAGDVIDAKWLDKVLETYAGSWMRNRIIFSLAALVAWCEAR